MKNITKICNKCKKDCGEEYAKKYYQENKEKIKEQAKKWSKENPDKIKKIYTKYRKTAKYRKKNRIWARKNRKKQLEYYQKNKIKKKEKKRKYDKKNRKKLNKYRQNKLNQDMSFKISCYIRNRINIALKRNYKKGKTFDLLGCSISELKYHLQKQFKKGMNWNNYGFYGWHIDHIKPCCSFDLSKAREQHKCFHYSNLQPLWAKDNHKKRIKDNLLRIKKDEN